MRRKALFQPLQAGGEEGAGRHNRRARFIVQRDDGEVARFLVAAAIALREWAHPADDVDGARRHAHARHSVLGELEKQR